MRSGWQGEKLYAASANVPSAAETTSGSVLSSLKVRFALCSSTPLPHPARIRAASPRGDTSSMTTSDRNEWLKLYRRTLNDWTTPGAVMVLTDG